MKCVNIYSICQARWRASKAICCASQLVHIQKRVEQVNKAMETRGKWLRCYSAKSCTILCPQNRFLKRATSEPVQPRIQSALQVDESFTPYASLFSFMPVFSASHLCFNILCSWATQHALTCSRSWMTFTVLFAVFVVRHVSRMIVCCVVCCPASTRNCKGSVG